MSGEKTEKPTAQRKKQARQEGADRSALVEIILKLTGEVRHQLGLQLDISRTLVDLRVVKEFHETVVDEICKWFDFPEAFLYPPTEEPGPE